MQHYLKILLIINLLHRAYDVVRKQIIALHQLFYQMQTNRDYPCYTFISAATYKKKIYRDQSEKHIKGLYKLKLILVMLNH